MVQINDHHGSHQWSDYSETDSLWGSLYLLDVWRCVGVQHLIPIMNFETFTLVSYCNNSWHRNPEDLDLRCIPIIAKWNAWFFLSHCTSKYAVCWKRQTQCQLTECKGSHWFIAENSVLSCAHGNLSQTKLKGMNKLCTVSNYKD